MAASSRTPTPAEPPMPCTRPIAYACNGVRAGVPWRWRVGPKAPRRHWTSTRRASAMITPPTATSAPGCTASGREDLKSTNGTPKTNSDVAWPRPHVNPSRPARRGSGSSEATSVVTAARWSGSVAWRRPSRIAIRAMTANTSPAPIAAMLSSRPNIELLLTGRAQAGQREVGEAGLVSDGRADGGADLAQDVMGHRLVAAAALAGDVFVVLGGRRVEAGPMAEVHVAHEPELLQRLEVAIDAREIAAR